MDTDIGRLRDAGLASGSAPVPPGRAAADPGAEPAAHRVHARLRAEILDGLLPPGSRLREERIAHEQGTSRTPVREAIRRLVAEGLAVLEPRRGAEVAAWETEDLEELFELRILLEGYAAARAATSGTADTAALGRLCEQMEAIREPPEHDEITRLNLEFHRAIHRAGSRRVLPDLVARVVEAPLVRSTFRRYSPAELDRSFAQHRELVTAIAAGDGEWARAVMTAHLRAARATVLRPVSGPSGPSPPDPR